MNFTGVIYEVTKCCDRDNFDTVIYRGYDKETAERTAQLLANKLPCIILSRNCAVEFMPELWELDSPDTWQKLEENGIISHTCRQQDVCKARE